MTDRTSEPPDWALWFYWIMATTLGWILGSLFFTALPMAFSGVAIAGLQWAILYKRIHQSWRWAILSAASWIAGYILFILFIPPGAGFLLGPLMGTILGILQWFLLRQEFEWAGWWIPISILAWTTGLTVAPGLLTSGALPGALTGLALVILFRYSSRGGLNRPSSQSGL